MSSYTIPAGARVLWCLRRRTTDVRCVMLRGTQPVEIHVVQDRDIVLTELFQEAWLAESWARAYSDRLKQQGWHDSSTSVAHEHGPRASAEHNRRG